MNEKSKRVSGQDQAVKDFLRGLTLRNEEQVIPHILETLGRYYDADRAYILAENGENRLLHNIWEWRGEAAQTKSPQPVPVDSARPWLDWLEEA